MANLNALVGRSFTVDTQYYLASTLSASYTPSTYTISSFPTLPDLTSMNVQILGGAGPGASRGIGQSVKIVSVDNSLQTISGVLNYPQIGDANPFTYFVIGYSASTGSILIDTTHDESHVALELALGGSAIYPSLNSEIGVLSGAAISPQTVSYTGIGPNDTISLTAGGTAAGTSTGSGNAVYRFFSKVDGTHFFTSSVGERDNILSLRPDMVEETNGFGAVTSTTQGAVAVYRFFDTVHGTHFFTSSASERDDVQANRSDLTYEPSATFYELSSNTGNNVAVYRLFDTKLGTHFYTGDAQEYAGITTAGSATYRADLKPEGVSFYAPAGSYS